MYASQNYDHFIEEKYTHKVSSAQPHSKDNQNLTLPPPQPLIASQYKENDQVNTGLNIYFKKLPPFSQDPSSGAGPLNSSQPKDINVPIDYPVYSNLGQQTLNQYVQSKMDNVMYCRYGVEYLRQFQKNTNANQMRIGRTAILQRKMNQTHERLNKNSLYVIPYYKNYEDNDIEFDSIFESGNLALAIKVSDQEYDLILQNDVNTRGHTQWFYFKAQGNFSKNQEIKFNIINLYKPASMYQHGMKILKLDMSKENPIWERSGTNIAYIPNTFIKDQGKTYYTLTFTMQFKKGQNSLCFAHSVPYTYSMLNEYLANNCKKKFLLCYSLAGNKCEYLHITNSQVDQKRTKQIIFITARVHPGESNASWMMKGILDMLLNPASEEEKFYVKQLKEDFEFYIIPMLNVDGVIAGNYRCALSACDLNRKWEDCSNILHPTIYYTKQLCQQLQELDRKFFLYLDLHGHSAKKNAFQYGNKLEAWHNRQKKKECRFVPKMFPYIFSQQIDCFNFSDCSFSMPKSKEQTARITMFHELQIPFVFTLEASFAGANKGELAGMHFSTGDFENIGKGVLKTLYQLKKIEYNRKLIKEMQSQAESQPVQEKDQDSDEEIESSDDEPEDLNKEQIEQAIQQLENDSNLTERETKTKLREGSAQRKQKRTVPNSANKNPINGIGNPKQPKTSQNSTLISNNNPQPSVQKQIFPQKAYSLNRKEIMERKQSNAHAKNNSMVSYIQFGEMNSPFTHDVRLNLTNKAKMAKQMHHSFFNDKISHKSSRNVLNPDQTEIKEQQPMLKSILMGDQLPLQNIKSVEAKNGIKPFQKLNKNPQFFAQKRCVEKRTKSYQQKDLQFFANTNASAEDTKIYNNHYNPQIAPQYQECLSLLADESLLNQNSFNFVRHAQILKQYVQNAQNQKLTSQDLETIKDFLQKRQRKQNKTALGNYSGNFPQISKQNSTQQQYLETGDEDYRDSFYGDKVYSKTEPKSSDVINTKQKPIRAGFKQTSFDMRNVYFDQSRLSQSPVPEQKYGLDQRSSMNSKKQISLMMNRCANSNYD